MRRRIRLTGRKQLSKSAVQVVLSEIGEKPILTMTIVDTTAFKVFPDDARVSLRLVENKSVEILDFGTIGKIRATRDLSQKFTAPSCQLRVADPGTKAKGLLLASTDNWTIRGKDAAENDNSKGILQFLADDTYPQTWKLELRDDDYPLVRVDKRIPNAAMWARNDPVFVGSALPAIVHRIFDAILREEYSEDVDWVANWLHWADSIMPGADVPVDDDPKARNEYIDRLLDSFCNRHELSDKLLEAAQPKEAL